MQAVSQKETGDLAVPGLISYSNENGTEIPQGISLETSCVEHNQ